jgi:SH3-like domain-containing protein
MRNSRGTGPVTKKRNLAVGVVLFIAASVSFLAGCSGGPSGRAEFVYVAIPEASLRDRVATIYTKTGLVHNGERLQVLERMQNKRFVRVRTPRGEEGWLQERFLADQQTYDQFARLAEQYRAAPAQATATIELQVKVHVLPGRKTGYLYLLNEKDKVELLERRTVDRNATPGREEKPKDADADSSDDEPDKPGQPAIWEDWWLIRDAQKRIGWVLGHAMYLDVPDEIAQYAEGQRIVAVYKLAEVPDGGKKVSEYLTLLTEPKDGMPYDFNQARVFTWNARKHRYETAFHESKLAGVLPVTMGQQDFGKEGSLPTFTLLLKQDGDTRQQTYKFRSPIVRKVYAAGEEPKSKSHSKKTSAHTAAKAAPSAAPKK